MAPENTERRMHESRRKRRKTRDKIHYPASSSSSLLSRSGARLPESPPSSELPEEAVSEGMVGRNPRGLSAIEDDGERALSWRVARKLETFVMRTDAWVEVDQWQTVQAQLWAQAENELNLRRERSATSNKAVGHPFRHSNDRGAVNLRRERSATSNKALKIQVSTIRSHFCMYAKDHIMQYYNLREMDAEERRERVQFLTEKDRFIFSTDTYETMTKPFMNDAIPAVIYGFFFKRTRARGNKETDHDVLMRSVQAPVVCLASAALLWALREYLKKGIREKGPNFDVNGAREVYRRFWTLWHKMPVAGPVILQRIQYHIRQRAEEEKRPQVIERSDPYEIDFAAATRAILEIRRPSATDQPLAPADRVRDLDNDDVVPAGGELNSTVAPRNSDSALPATSGMDDVIAGACGGRGTAEVEDDGDDDVRDSENEGRDGSTTEVDE